MESILCPQGGPLCSPISTRVPIRMPPFAWVSEGVFHFGKIVITYRQFGKQRSVERSMARIITEGDSIRVPVNPNVTRDYEGIVFAQQGRPIWTILEIDVENSYQDITLTAEFDYAPGPKNPLEQRQNSKIGIWLPVEDKVSKRPFAQFEENYRLWGKEKTYAKLSKWTFGRKATVEITIDETTDDNFVQKFALCVCPWFPTAYDEGCELTLTLHGKKFGAMRKLEIFRDKITFIIDENGSEYEEDTEEVMRLFYDLKAFEISGNGNSLHPKQLYTIEGLKKCLDKFDNQSVEIAYIGTDTTENLRSVIRTLTSDLQIARKIKSLDVYFTKDWDKPLMNRFPESIQINKKSSKNLFDLNPIELPEDESLPDGLSSAHIIISTYVTPWVLEKETNLEQYKSLLMKLMTKESSVLLTIDPSSSEYIIRDNLTDELQKVRDLYVEELDLKGNPVNEEINKIADTVVWRKR